MTTAAVMAARIADDLARGDLSNQIYAAMNDAVRAYHLTRFYFNETRNSTFSTVAAQSLYTSADSADIPDMFEFDDVQITVGGNVYSLEREDATVLEQLIGSTASSGDPLSWAWANQGLLLYPIPNAVRTIRMIGAIQIEGPETPTTEGNIWMNEGYDLIMAHAKLSLALHTIHDQPMAEMMAAAAAGAKAYLERATSSKRATSRITATAF
jgi:hypothetical protein